MSYNEILAHRLRLRFQAFSIPFTEKKMFGGLSFLYKNKMTVGIIKNELVVRIINDKIDSYLVKEGIRPMDFTKRPMKEFVFVEEEHLVHENQLDEWIILGIEHAKTKLNEI